MRLRIIAFAAAIAAAILAAWTAVTFLRGGEDRAPGIAVANRDLGGPFTLTDHTGAQVTAANFRGRYMLVYFGYSYCPDVCPTELQAMGRALDRLDPSLAERVVPVFVTVDPARDTPEVMARYVKAFHPRMVGLTGTEAQVAAAAKAYKVYSRLGEPSAPGADDYLVDHTSFVYLMGPDGGLAALFRSGSGPAALADGIARAMD